MLKLLSLPVLQVQGNGASGITCGANGACVLLVGCDVVGNGGNGVVAAQGGSVKVEGGSVSGNKSAGTLSVGGGQMMLKALVSVEVVARSIVNPARALQFLIEGSFRV